MSLLCQVVDFSLQWHQLLQFYHRFCYSCFSKFWFFVACNYVIISVFFKAEGKLTTFVIVQNSLKTTRKFKKEERQIEETQNYVSLKSQDLKGKLVILWPRTGLLSAWCWQCSVYFPCLDFCMALYILWKMQYFMLFFKRKQIAWLDDLQTRL